MIDVLRILQLDHIADSPIGNVETRGISGGQRKRVNIGLELCADPSLLFLVPFCLFAIWISWDFVTNSLEVLERSPDPGGLPRWPLKLVVPLAFALLGLQGLSEATKRIAFLSGMSAEEVGLVEPPLVNRDKQAQA